MTLLSKLTERFKWHGGSRSNRSGQDVDTAVPGLPQAQLMKRHKHFYEPLVAPVWRDPQAAEHMLPDDPVLGLYVDGQAWGFPWWILKNHHAANVMLSDRPVMVALCEMCSSGAAFDARVKGQRHTFRVVGKYNGSHFIRDYETDSSWAPFSGECLEGELKAEELARLPLSLAAWSDWLNEQPATKVLYGSQEARQGHGSEFSPGSPGNVREAQGMLRTLVRPIDERLPNYELVLGAKANGEARAYPLSVLETSGPVTNDVLGGREIAIFHRPGTLMATAFFRTVDGKVLTFYESEAGVIGDRELGRRWNYAGESIGASEELQKLDFVWSGTEQWYIWAAYHPDSGIFSIG